MAAGSRGKVNLQFALMRPHRIRERHFIQSISKAFWGDHAALALGVLTAMST
jgi:hypothetical protein